MKLHTYNAIQLFLTDAQKAKLEKVCFAYQMIYDRLFNRVQHAVQAKLEVDYARMIIALKHEDEQLGTDVFSKYPQIVKGAELKVRSVFMPVKNIMDCILMRGYLERERFNGNVVLPILNNNNGKVEVPHLGELSKEGKTKGGLFLEFVRSKHIRQDWHAKAIVETTINPAKTRAGVLTVTHRKEAPFILMDTDFKSTPIDGMKEHAHFIETKATSLSAALRRMNNSHDCVEHDFRQGSRDRQFRAFDMERRAYEYAPTFAKQLVETFSTFGYCAPVTEVQQLTWDYLGLDILMAETERLMLQAASENKLMKAPIYKFFDLAYCPRCDGPQHSKADMTFMQVVCSKRNHDRIEVNAAVANNTVKSLLLKL